MKKLILTKANIHQLITLRGTKQSEFFCTDFDDETFIDFHLSRHLVQDAFMMSDFDEGYEFAITQTEKWISGTLTYEYDLKMFKSAKDCYKWWLNGYKTFYYNLYKDNKL
jgi:hypothetical protein